MNGSLQPAVSRYAAARTRLRANGEIHRQSVLAHHKEVLVGVEDAVVDDLGASLQRG